LIFNCRSFIIAQYRQKCISKNYKLTTFHHIFLLYNIKTFLIIFLKHSYFFKFIIKNFNSYHNIYFSFQLIKSAHKKDFETLVYLLNEAHCKKCFLFFVLVKTSWIDFVIPPWMTPKQLLVKTHRRNTPCVEITSLGLKNLNKKIKK
jgi:hypothetical protein